MPADVDDADADAYNAADASANGDPVTPSRTRPQVKWVCELA